MKNLLPVIYLRRSIFRTLICILCIKNQQNALNSTNVLLLWYIQLHVSAGNPAIFRMTLLLQEYIAIKCVKLLLNIKIHMNIDYNFFARC